MDFHEDLDDGLLTLTMDDGKRNALDRGAFERLAAVLDDRDDARAVVLAGREGVFTAGLDVKFIASASRDDMVGLLTAFGRALMRVWTDPRPVVCAATGHAVAAGTMLSMCCDHSVAAAGDFTWGLTETRINFEMPQFGITLARHNVASHRIDDLILPGATVGPSEAVAVGYADVEAPPDEVLATARRRARELLELPPEAYAGTKARLRREAADRVLADLDADVDRLLARFPG